MNESLGHRDHISFLARHRGDPGIFGDPDGHRAAIHEFIDVAELRHSPFYGQTAERIRVVIGRKGSGKTFCLRRLRNELESNDSLTVADANLGRLAEPSEPTQLLRTLHVLQVSQWYPEPLLTEAWQLLWGRAIITASATHLAYNRSLRPHLSDEEHHDLLADFSELKIFSRSREPRSPLTALKALVTGHRTGTALDRFLDDPLWDDLEARVGSLLGHCPPLYFLIDSIDEEFSHAPGYWLRCQKGLFYETMRLLRNSRLGGRLHVVISIRDVVLYSVFRSEHATRYVGDPHIRVLDWGRESARAFLDGKINRMPEALRERHGNPTSLTEWLGFSSVTNSLGEVEGVYDYLLRHTQCLPRDIVAFGNFLGEHLDAHLAAGKPLDEATFRDIVSDVAMLAGLQQLSVAASHVVADEIPAEAMKYGFEDVYLSVAEYKRDRIDEIVVIIEKCKTLRFDKNTFLELQAAGQESFSAPDLGTVLWQAGLLGVEGLHGTTSAVFFSFDRMGRLRIPIGDELTYVFHPCMREIAGLKPGDRAVL